MDRCRSGSSQPLAVLPCMLQTCAHAFAQNLPFKLGEDCKQPCHGSTGRSCQIQSFCERHEPDSQMFQFLKGCQQIRNRPSPAIQPPHQDNVDFAAARSRHQLLPAFALRGARGNFFHLENDLPTPAGGVFLHRFALHGKSLLVLCRYARIKTSAQRGLGSLAGVAKNPLGF